MNCHLSAKLETCVALFCDVYLQHELQIASNQIENGCRQERPAEAQAAAPVSKAELNGLVFKQNWRSNALVVARTLAARLASPHSLHLDNLKLTDCCIIEG